MVQWKAERFAESRDAVGPDKLEKIRNEAIGNLGEIWRLCEELPVIGPGTPKRPNEATGNLEKLY
jgi:hypothetical protein